MSEQESRNLVSYLGVTFGYERVNRNFTPEPHPCIIFDLGGDHLGRLIRHIRKECDEGLPVLTVRRFMQEILTGIKYIHDCLLIHTDIKPENILMNVLVENVQSFDDITLKISDLGSATPYDKLHSKHVGTDGYCAPELIAEIDYTQAIDIWSAFVVCFEMFTGVPLFDVYGEHTLNYGEDIRDDVKDDVKDDNHVEDDPDRVGDDHVHNNEHVSNNDHSMEHSDNSYTSNESEISEYTVNYRQLLIMEKLLGPAPKEYWTVCRTFYNRLGHLMHNPEVERSSISKFLSDNYELSVDVCNDFEEFLLTGLRYLPEERCTAEQALRHKWLHCT